MVPQVASTLSGPSRKIQINIKTLDCLVSSGSPVPQFIKIDTEGAEFAVIQGARDTLAAYKPELFIEMHGTTRQHWRDNRKSVQEFIESCGYTSTTCRERN